MRQRYTIELAFLLLVLAVSVTGFSSLFRDGAGPVTGYQLLHIVTSLAWLLLLTAQLVLLRQRKFERHRTIGACILAAAPVLIASVSLLTAHSAGREAAAGTVDDLVVQNVTFTVELALLLLLATFDRFAKSAQLGALIGMGIGVIFFLRNVRTGWPWLLTSGFLLGNGLLQAFVAQTGRTWSLTMLVGSVGELSAVSLALAGSVALLWAAWKQSPGLRRR